MADECDVTQDRLEREEAARLKALSSLRPRAQVMDDEGEVICADCGGGISLGRKMAGYANCIDCQSELEKKTRVGKRILHRGDE